jgi:hypothetical protein
MKMPESTTKRRRPKYRRLTVEVEESVAARLEARAASSSRYRHGGDVAAQIVTLYIDLYDELQEEKARFVERQVRRERRRGFKAGK